MEYKEANKDAYDSYAGEFEERTKNYIEEHILEDAELFISNLSGRRILDLGSGPGRDALFFRGKGLSPLCVDISPAMIWRCIEKFVKIKFL